MDSLRPSVAIPLLTFVLAASCSSSNSQSGSDAGSFNPGACPDRPAIGDYPADVAAVISNKCTTCHKNPPVNHAPFPLVSYTDTVGPDPVAPYQGQPIWQVMGQVIQPNANPHMPFGDAPQLTSAEFATLDGWLSSCALPSQSASDGGVEGNVLIADQFNNRVIEVNRQGSIVWSFGDGSSVPGPTSVVAPNDAERLPGGQTLIAGTGAPAGTEPTCTVDAGGCPDNRVIIVDDATGKIVWQFPPLGDASTDDMLNVPVAAAVVPAGADGSASAHVLITDQGTTPPGGGVGRIIEVDEATFDIVWQFPPATATTAQQLNSPNSAERLSNGNTLITDEGGNRVIEVKNDGTIVWQYPPVGTAADSGTALSGPAFASRLPNGDTLITDGINNRILEVTSETPPQTVLDLTMAGSSSSALNLPTRAVRLANNDTLIADQANDRVIEIDATPAHNVVFTYGMSGTAGSGANQLNMPYDAKVIGDYTGLTPPQ
jgi:hypothetical protein